MAAEVEQPFTYDEIQDWIAEVHDLTGHIPTICEIAKGCHTGISWATVCLNDYQKSLVAQCLSQSVK